MSEISNMFDRYCSDYDYSVKLDVLAARMRSQLVPDKEAFAPTFAELRAIKDPRKLAAAHGQVLRSWYSISATGEIKDAHPMWPEAHEYYMGVLAYLCSRKAGILLRRGPLIDAKGGCGSEITREHHLRDVNWAMRILMEYKPFVGINEDHPHKDVLGLYIDHGYICDDPLKQVVPVGDGFKTWLERAAFICTPDLIEAHLERDVDLGPAITQGLLDRRLQQHRTRSAAGGWIYSPSRYYELTEVSPGDFLGYFKICGNSNFFNDWQSDDRCVAIVKSMEADRMLKSIDQARDSAGAPSPSQPSAAIPAAEAPTSGRRLRL